MVFYLVLGVNINIIIFYIYKGVFFKDINIRNLGIFVILWEDLVIIVIFFK